MSPTNNVVHTEQIVKDITSTALCSYQIAHKYNLTKMTVDRIARTHLGEQIYQKKEHLALEHLKGDFLKLRSQGFSINNIGQKLGLSKASAFNLSKKFESEANNSEEVIQIDSIPPFIDTQINALPQVVTIASESTVHEESKIKKDIPESPYRPVHKVPYQKKEYSVIRLKGLQISFDASIEGMDETISKVLKALQ
ncbi:MAG: hypothetical protein ACI4M9_02350 [Succinivibrio sp.]